MRLSVILVLTLLVMAACGPNAKKPSLEPAETGLAAHPANVWVENQLLLLQNLHYSNSSPGWIGERKYDDQGKLVECSLIPEELLATNRIQIEWEGDRPSVIKTHPKQAPRVDSRDLSRELVHRPALTLSFAWEQDTLQSIAYNGKPFPFAADAESRVTSWTIPFVAKDTIHMPCRMEYDAEGRLSKFLILGTYIPDRIAYERLYQYEGDMLHSQIYYHEDNSTLDNPMRRVFLENRDYTAYRTVENGYYIQHHKGENLPDYSVNFITAEGLPDRQFTYIDRSKEAIMLYCKDGVVERRELITF